MLRRFFHVLFFYTACTRAASELFLVNFNKVFFASGAEE